MSHSKLIAGLMGPLLLAMGTAMLVNRNLLPTMAADLARNSGLIFLTGVLSLLAGVAVVRVHNVWSGGWPIIVTILGWLAVVGGLARMWFPELAAPIVTGLNLSATGVVAGGLVVSALGAFLSFKAYTSEG